MFSLQLTLNLITFLEQPSLCMKWARSKQSTAVRDLYIAVAVLLRRHLAEVAGFAGNQKAYYDVDNSCLNTVLEKGTGIPVTLGLVYLLVTAIIDLHHVCFCFCMCVHICICISIEEYLS